MSAPEETAAERRARLRAEREAAQAAQAAEYEDAVETAVETILDLRAGGPGDGRVEEALLALRDAAAEEPGLSRTATRLLTDAILRSKYRALGGCDPSRRREWARQHGSFLRRVADLAAGTYTADPRGRGRPRDRVRGAVLLLAREMHPEAETDDGSEVVLDVATTAEKAVGVARRAIERTLALAIPRAIDREAAELDGAA